MLVADLDEVTYDLEVDGEEVRRTLHRRVYEHRGWATVVLAYQERAADGTWRAPKLALIRLQHVREAWKKHATITLRGTDAVALGQALAEWQADLASAGEHEADDG